MSVSLLSWLGPPQGESQWDFVASGVCVAIFILVNFIEAKEESSFTKAAIKVTMKESFQHNETKGQEQWPSSYTDNTTLNDSLGM